MARERIEDMHPDTLYDRWRGWIERMYDETISLGWNRRQFRMMREVANGNARLRETGGHVLDWMFGNYVVSAAMTFRRELDKQGGTENLRHLLHEIEKRPEVLSRARYRQLWGPVPKSDWYGPDEAFNKWPVAKDSQGPDRDHIDPEVVRTDRLKLEEETEHVREYVERTYAHRTPKGEPTKESEVTFADFHAALDAVAEVFKKYYALITLGSLMTTEPVPQYDTHECFTFPWVEVPEHGRGMG